MESKENGLKVIETRLYAENKVSQEQIDQIYEVSSWLIRSIGGERESNKVISHYWECSGLNLTTQIKTQIWASDLESRKLFEQEDKRLKNYTK